MVILLYMAAQSEAVKRFGRMVINSVSAVGSNTAHTIEDLIERLVDFSDDERIIVYFAGTNKELVGLCSISFLLASARLILIAPDRSEETIAVAHGLYPRFLLFFLLLMMTFPRWPMSWQKCSGKRLWEDSCPGIHYGTERQLPAVLNVWDEQAGKENITQ